MRSSLPNSQAFQPFKIEDYDREFPPLPSTERPKRISQILTNSPGVPEERVTSKIMIKREPLKAVVIDIGYVAGRVLTQQDIGKYMNLSQ